MSRLFESFGDDDADEAPSRTASTPDVSDLLDSVEELEAFDEESPFDVPPFGDGFQAPISAGIGSALIEPAVVEPDVTREIDSGRPNDIPDFDQDEKDLAGYEDARKRYIRQQISSGETAIQASFAQKREQLQAELKNARSFEDERRASALHTTRQYANSYPQHVDKRGISPPTFWENVLSFGRAGKLYRLAFVATEALDQLRQAMRKREESLAALEGQMSRAIYLKEESIKKAMETEAGIAEFNGRAEIKQLFLRTEQIRKERERYAARLDRGEVSDEEQRDRAMAEQHLVYAELPIMGAIIAKVARFGSLSYFQLRDLERKESFLSYDSRLDPLRNCVFDIYSVAGTVAAKLKRNDNGTAFRVADHFKFCWRNQDKAEELYSQHRAALREDRGLAALPPRNEGEVEILDRLAHLASLIDGSGNVRTAEGTTQPPASNTPPPIIPR